MDNNKYVGITTATASTACRDGTSERRIRHTCQVVTASTAAPPPIKRKIALAVCTSIHGRKKYANPKAITVSGGRSTIGRASCRERVCTYVVCAGVAD